MRTLRAVAAACILALTVSACATEITGTPRLGEAVPSDRYDDSAADPVTEEPAAEEPADDTPTEPAESAEGDRQPGFAVPEGGVPDTSAEPIRPVDPNDGDPDTGQAGAEGASADWLRVFCGGMDDVSQYSAPDITGLTDAEAQTVVVNTYDAMSAAAVGAAQHLDLMPPPDFDPSIAMAMTEWLWTVDEVYFAGARRLEERVITDEAEFGAAIDEIEAGLDDANARLTDAITRMDDADKTLLRTLPECAFLTR